MRVNQRVKPLIDSDILRYEIAAVGEKLNKDTGEIEIADWDFIEYILDNKISDICTGAGATEPPILFLTGRGNFREALATAKTYKGTRRQNKPFHFKNIGPYLHSKYEVRLAEGCEADDLLGIEQHLSGDATIVCTRDKDLRMIPGWHYGWECGKQGEFGPVYYDSVGKIELVRTSSGNKIRGGGFAFFASQLLTGDVVDNIGGLANYGPVKTHKLLDNCTTEREYFSAVRSVYEEALGDGWLESLTEQCHLLYILRERNEDGSLKHFNIEEWL